MKNSEEKKVKRKSTSPFLTIGLQEHIYSFYEDLSILLNSGMDMISAIKIIQEEVQSPRMKKILRSMIEDLDAGVSFSESIQQQRLAPGYVMALIQTGEASGTLPNNLTVAVTQQRRIKNFFSSIRSALVYPAIVLSLTAAVGLGSAWFILPRLTSTFLSLDVELPLITQLLIGFGDFIREYGQIVVPGVVVILLLLVYFLFFFNKTRFIGLALLFSLPLTRGIVRDSEVARFGFVFGVLLDAGLSIIPALNSVIEATELHSYKKLFLYLKDNMEAGQSFQSCFKDYKKSKKLIPLTAQHMIVAGERGGSLPKALLSIGETYERKTTSHLSNVTNLIEPLVIIIVGMAVAAVAMSILLPVYSLIGGIR